MPVDLQTTGQRIPLVLAEVSSGTGASGVPEGPSPDSFSPEARAALERLTGSSRAAEPAPLPVPSVTSPLRSVTPPATAPATAGAALPGAVRGAATPREIAKNLTMSARSLADPNETQLYGNVLSANGVAIDVPLVTGDNAWGMRRAVRLELKNVVMPDGSQIARGSGRVTLLVRDGVVTGMLDDSLQYDTSTTYLKPASDGALSGHRGEPGRVVSGAAVVRDGRVVGLAANSAIDIDGLRIRSGDDEVAYRFTPPDLYTLGAGATVLSTPDDRAVRVSGAQVAIERGNVTTRLAEGATARVAARGAAIQVEGASETWRTLPAPAPIRSHVNDVANGTIVLQRIPGATLFADGVTPQPFDQIGAGDCYLVGPMLATAQMRPEMIRRLITDNHDGTYTVHFMGDDGPVDITVDDRFYMTARSGERALYREKEGDLARYTSSLTPMVYAANPIQQTEIWGPVVEKAYALWKGGYDAIYSGYPDIALRQITGRLSDTTAHSGSNPDAVYAAIEHALANRQPTFAITEQPSTPATQAAVDEAFRRDFGMRNSHVYVVSGTMVENGVRYVVMRNTERLIEGTSSEYATDVDRDGDGKPDGADGYFRLRYDDYFSRFVMTTTMNPERRFVPGVKQVPYAQKPSNLQ